jgi:hypothetical protein
MFMPVPHLPFHLRPPECIKPLVRVPNERQTSCILIASLLRSLRPVRRTRIILVDLIDGEVLRIDVRLQLRFKRCANAAEAVPGYAAEEGVLFDFVGAADAAEAVFGVADEAAVSQYLLVKEMTAKRDNKREGHTVSQSPQPQHRVAGLEGNADYAASPQSCGTYHAAPPHRTAASRSSTQT